MKGLDILCVAAGLLVLVSCGGGTSSRKTVRRADSLVLNIPQAPVMVEDKTERLKYSFNHYWDNLSPAVYSESLEEQFANWSWMSDRVSITEGRKSLLEAYAKDPVRIAALSEKYLYDPQSPYRNEDLYAVIAQKEGKENIAAMCALNAVGTRAADFVTEDRRGRRSSLYEVKADYTLIFFSNPYCNACKDIIEILKDEETVFPKMVNSGELAVVNMYIDEDLEQWRSYLKAYPRNWHTAFDPTFTLRNNEKYNIRAIPSLYLLDENKVVLMKDAPIEKIADKLYGKF